MKFLKSPILLIFFSFLFFSCQKNNEVKAEDKTDQNIEEIKKRISSVTYSLVDLRHNFDVTVTFDSNNSLTAAEENQIAGYLGNVFSHLSVTNIAGIDVFYYHEAGETIITLVGLGIDSNGNDAPIGIGFIKNDEGTGGTISLSTHGGNSEQHSCSGSPCTCCDFLYEKSTSDTSLLGCINCKKKILGCECRTVPARCATINGTCNHTKTSTN